MPRQAQKHAAVDLYTYFPDLKSENINAVAQLSQLKALVKSDVSICGDGDYGFIGWDNMPSGVRLNPHNCTCFVSLYF